MGQLDAIFGATLVGVVVNAWILGLIFVLSYQYYTTFPRDSRVSKVLVGFVWFVQTLNAAVITSLIYYFLVTSYTTPVNLTFAPWSWGTFITLESITATCVQVFYAQRVYGLSRSYFLTGVVGILSLSQLTFGLGTAGVTIRLKFFAKFIPWTWISLTWLGSSAACDIVITGVQVYYLYRNRSQVPQTRRMVAKLLVSIIATGAITTVVALLEVFTFAFLGFNFVHVVLSYPNGAIYVISLLANLHVRGFIRKDDTSVINMDTVRFAKETRSSGNTSATRSAPLFVARKATEESTIDDLSFDKSKLSYTNATGDTTTRASAV